MIELTSYKCEFCGTVYDNEDDCYQCEQRCLLGGMEKQIHLRHERGTPLPVAAESLEKYYFVKCDSIKAAKAFDKFHQHHLGTDSPYSDLTNFKPEFYAYNDNGEFGSEHGTWVCLVNEIEALEELVQLLENQGE